MNKYSLNDFDILETLGTGQKYNNIQDHLEELDQLNKKIQIYIWH